MLTTEATGKALELLDEGYTFPSITEATGITLEDVEAVHVAWFKGTAEQLFRELELAGVLELAAARLRSVWAGTRVKYPHRNSHRRLLVLDPTSLKSWLPLA